MNEDLKDGLSVVGVFSLGLFVVAAALSLAGSVFRDQPAQNHPQCVADDVCATGSDGGVK